ncbi:MAG: hypothetical protein V3S22_03005 [Candidatus Neomarinimicrobiota bacterium]
MSAMEVKSTGMLKKLIIFILILNMGSVYSQSARLEGQFFEYATFYISNIDIQTGTSDVPLFRYRIIADSYPLYARVWFRISLVSPALGLHSRAAIIELESNNILMQADLVLDNRNFSSASSFLYDEASPPNALPVLISINEIIDPAEFEDILSSVMTTGQLPDGEYTFEIELWSGSQESDMSLTDQDQKTIIVQRPSGLSLESPGGEIADTSFNLVYTTYPVFNWFTTGCKNCDTYIRVADFNPQDHGTPEDALRDETVLPFELAEGWEKIEEFSTYQYPVSGAKPLEYGHVYVWQIKNTITTTAGMEDLTSPIYAFKIENAATMSGGGLTALLTSLRSALGDDSYNALFQAGGSLNGFGITGSYILNNTSINEETFSRILKQIIEKHYSISKIEIRD